MKLVVNILICLLLGIGSRAQQVEYYVLFEYNKSEVPDTAMADLIKTIYSNDVKKVYLEGHCDSIGSRSYNYALSERRVKAVENLLVENGFDRKKITGKVGFGKDKPITPNSTDAARQQNRRVLVSFVGVKELPKKIPTPKITRAQIPKTVETKTEEIIRVKRAQIPTKEIGIPVGKKAYRKTAVKKIEDSSPTVKPKTFDRKNFVKGATIALPNLNFQGGRHYLLPRSTATLDSLLQILTENTTMVVEIQGHVCCTTIEPDGYDMDLGTPNLSETRAIAIKAFLVKKGISSTRLQTKGFGGRKKLFPDEENAYQRQKNRRVEVKIISE